MKKNQKVSDALGVICVVFIFAGCVEALDGGLTWWTPVALAIAVLFGVLSKKTEVEQVKPKNQ